MGVEDTDESADAVDAAEEPKEKAAKGFTFGGSSFFSSGFSSLNNESIIWMCL